MMPGNTKARQHGRVDRTLIVLIWSIGTTCANCQASQQNFFGRWMLDEARSRVLHSSDLKRQQWRSYEPDGDRVKVSWENAGGQLGTYSAKCDGTVEAAAAGKIRCWQKNANVIEGEQLDPNDTVHRYYSRVVSHDRRTMVITWYEDPSRRRAIDRIQYTKE
jgi:hypothetical protein